MQSLEFFIDEYYESVVMGKTNATSGAAASTTASTPNAKRHRHGSLDSASSPSSPSTDNSGFKEILESIDGKLTSLDARLALVELLHKEFQDLKISLEFSQQQVASLTSENQQLRGAVKTLTEEVSQLSGDNRKCKESILEIQSRSMRENMVFSGISEKTDEDVETSVRAFMQTQLKLAGDVVNSITFHRVHRLGGKKAGDTRPRPIVARFEHYKQKMQVKSRGRELRDTNFSMNDQFPAEILSRRRVLFPIRKKNIKEGRRAAISVDKLYINGQLFRDPEITPWLY